MARLKTAQPSSSLRKIAVVVATAVSGMSVYAQAAVDPKEETITVTAAPAPQEKRMGACGNHRRTTVCYGDQNRHSNSKSSSVYFCGHRRRDGVASAKIGQRGA